MSPTLDVAVIVGSLRRESYNRKVAKVLIELAPAPLRLEIVEIRDLPLFNQDDENAPPPAVVQFKQRIAATKALLFVTPEYNRSVPGVLKNAIDVGSRPHGQNSWSGKPGAVASCSPGVLSAFGANHHLRQSLAAVNIPVMPQPEVYIGSAATLFDESGALNNDKTRAILAKFLGAFATWIERNPAA